MGLKVNRFFIGRKGSYNTAYFTRVAKACPVSSTALQDGSFLICKAGGLAWFVSPNSTQIGSTWANGQYNASVVGTKCCISEWGTLGSLLSAGGYTPTEWFVPDISQLQNPGFACRTNWGSPTGIYWSSTEFNTTGGYILNLCIGVACGRGKTCSCCVRAFRCVTY
jgi:hypothetical protein